MADQVVAKWHLKWASEFTPVLHVTKSFTPMWNNVSTDQPQLDENFILDIEEALRDKLIGMRVTDLKASGAAFQRLVKVYYRSPQREVEETTYPFITIDFLRMERAATREQRGGPICLSYVPDGYTAPNGDPNNLITQEMPIPLDFTYQITSWARNVRHDRAIMAMIWADNRIPPRFGWLPVGGDMDHASLRYMDLIEGPTPADSMGGPGNKRVFRKAWTVRISGELFQRDILAIQRVRKITIDTGVIESVARTAELEYAVT